MRVGDSNGYILVAFCALVVFWRFNTDAQEQLPIDGLQHFVAPAQSDAINATEGKDLAQLIQGYWSDSKKDCAVGPVKGHLASNDDGQRFVVTRFSTAEMDSFFPVGDAVVIGENTPAPAIELIPKRYLIPVEYHVSHGRVFVAKQPSGTGQFAQVEAYRFIDENTLQEQRILDENGDRYKFPLALYDRKQFGDRNWNWDEVKTANDKSGEIVVRCGSEVQPFIDSFR